MYKNTVQCIEMFIFTFKLKQNQMTLTEKSTKNDIPFYFFIAYECYAHFALKKIN